MAMTNVLRSTKRRPSPPATRTMRAVSALVILAALMYLSSGVESETNNNLLSLQELQNLVDDLRGDDLRLMRWSASKHTRARQRNGGCDAMPRALQVILNHGKESDDELKGVACTYATFCVTDNPVQRANMSQQDGIHAAIVKLVGSSDSHTSAAASHLIYIASFANAQNQQGFYQAGAVQQLASVVKKAAASNSSSNLQIMWAAAALQNLAASYCDTEHDGRCYWKWVRGELEIRPKRIKLLSTSDESVRKDMVQDSKLVDSLMELACRGPVQGEMTSTNPFIGENAEIGGPHEESSNILAWAAAGALKNLALEPSARPMLEDSLKCLCRLSHSQDWLEENKGGGALHYLRMKDPCWFQDDDPTKKVCVDGFFLDQEGYTCSDYGDATDKECQEGTSSGGTGTANEACCACGGGSAEESWSRTTTTQSEREL